MIDPLKLRQYPPFVCRVIARRTVVVDGKRSVVPVSAMDISRASGLSIKRVHWISRQVTWGGVTLADAVAFLNGCGLINQPVWRLRWFLVRAAGKPNSLKHLDRLPTEDRRRVCQVYQQHFQEWIRGLSEDQDRTETCS